MAIEPFRQRIGIASPGSLISGNAPQVSDVGPAIRGVGMDILQAAQPTLRRKAIEAGEQAAGAAVIQRDEQGNPINIERPGGRGELFNAAFDKVAETRYLNDISYTFQNWAGTEINDRRVGKDGKAFDPDQFDAAVQGRLEGILKTVDPRLRPAVEVELYREALERTRAFRDEWGRTIRDQTIAGAKDQIEVLLNGYANYRNERLNPTQAYQKYGAPLDRLIIDLRDAGRIGGEQAEALLMRVDNLVTSVEDYAISMSAATGIIPLINGMGKTDVEIFGNWLRNAPDPRKLSGTITNGFSEEKVTPEVIKETWKSLFPNLGEPNSVDRPPEHRLSVASPTSYHNTKNGGRAIDVNPIKGMTFEEYVQIWKDNGFDVIEALEEVGPKRSQFASGDHWHLAFGNTRKVMQTAENPGMQLLDSEQVMALDPSVKQSLLAIVTNREQAIREEEALARQQAAEARRIAEDQANFDRVVNTINGNNTNGVGGDGTYNAEAKGVLDAAFAKNFDLAKVNDLNEQQRILAWVQDKNYVPATVVNYMENAAVSPNWKQAAIFYNSMKQTTLPTGGVVGDLMVSKLSARSRAILEQVTSLVSSGQPDELILPFIDRARAGATYTRDDAVNEYNATLSSSRNPKPYDNDRRKAIIEAFNLPSGQSIPPNLSNLIDQSFAANLDLFSRNPEQALAKAIEQNKVLYTRSGIFTGGFGPSIVQRTLGGDPAVANKNLLRFFQDMRSNGKPILPTLTDSKGRRIPHTVGGANSTIRLTPLDTQTTSVGMYRVDVIHPETKQVIKLRERFDMGSELYTWMQTLPAKPAQKPKVDVNAARQKQEAIGRRLINAASSLYGT